MRLLVVAEGPPTCDARHGDGSTLITAHVLPRLPPDWTIDLVWFRDRPARPDEAVTRRCRRSVPLPVRPDAAGMAAIPVTTLPRAAWQRRTRVARRAISCLAASADAVYLHGLHTFPFLADVDPPALAHEVDDWSCYWEERARGRSLPAAAYDRLQAGRARRLEALTGRRAGQYVVVAEEDARSLSRRLGRAVTPVPVGLDTDRLRPDPPAVEPDLVGFVGTLDYPPNVAAVRALVRDVLPALRSRVPGVRVLVAGRRPGPDVLRLAGPGVEILGDIPDVAGVFARLAVAVYPGGTGRGTKNTVLEALACGCPVVAGPAAARGVEPGEHLTVASDPVAVADRVAELLREPGLREAAAEAARRYAVRRASWDAVAERYAHLLTSLR